MTTVDQADPRIRAPRPGFDASTLGQDPFRPSQPEARTPGGDEQQYDESTESRFTLWAGAWELIQQRPMGIGFNRFKREITPYVPPQLAGKDAHNFYVLLTTEAGVLAPLMLLVLLFGLIGLGLRLARIEDDEEARMLGNGFVLATLAVMLGNIYGSRFLDGDVMGLYWILGGIVARVYCLKEAALKQRRAEARAAKASRRAAFGGPVVPVRHPRPADGP